MKKIPLSASFIWCHRCSDHVQMSTNHLDLQVSAFPGHSLVPSMTPWLLRVVLLSFCPNPPLHQSSPAPIFCLLPTTSTVSMASLKQWLQPEPPPRLDLLLFVPLLFFAKEQVTGKVGKKAGEGGLFQETSCLGSIYRRDGGGSDSPSLT